MNATTNSTAGSQTQPSAEQAQTGGSPRATLTLVPAETTRQPAIDGNKPLPRKSRTRAKDNAEYSKFAARMIRAYGRRVTAEDPSDLTGLLRLRDELDATIANTAKSLHEQGWSWGEIAYEIGVTPQAARQRWGK